MANYYANSETMNLVNLPDVVLEEILSNLSYDEIAKDRIVRKTLST